LTELGSGTAENVAPAESTDPSMIWLSMATPYPRTLGQLTP
jgi:hypothetical protein